MCGITGFWSFTSENKVNLTEIVSKMNSFLAHRGPDDRGVWVDEIHGLALGHSRLSIIDLSSSGHQPMQSSCGRYVISYNGEVYNFKEIRETLENRGVSFRGHSDTEVVLAAISTWGLQDALKKFNGMFSFALWDKKDSKLYLVRDRVGIKPLYFGIQKNILFFSSELKAIRAHPSFDAELDFNNLALFFRHNYIPAPFCIYKDLQKLLPGHFAVISMDSKIKVVNYWDIREISSRKGKEYLDLSEKKVESTLESLLLDSVNIRMRSDVPLGAFLSGGVDSSLIVALMQAQSSLPVKTFTVGFYKDEFNEAQYAKKVAEHLGTKHTELYVKPKQAQEVISRLPDIYDEPFSDSSQIPTFLISQLTRHHVTVSLSGDGGDELFAGYNRYFRVKDFWEKTRFIPNPLKHFLSGTIRSISSDGWDRFFSRVRFLMPDIFKKKMFGGKLYELTEFFNCRTTDDLYKRFISHWTKPQELVAIAKEPATVIGDRSLSTEIPDFVDRMMFLDLVTYLPDDILTKVDRASMAVSLEARVPMLDHRIIEFSKKLPLNLKIKREKSKWLLRKILYKYIPEKLIDRPKMGFAIPIDTWLSGPLRDWAEDLLSKDGMRKEGILDPEPIHRLWREHLTGKCNWGHLLWDVLMFQSWYKRWMKSSSYERSMPVAS